MSVDLEADVEALGQRLGQAIARLPEYDRFERAQQAVKDSDEAQAAIESFEQQRETYLLARQHGEAEPDDVRDLQRAQQELHTMPVMQEYIEAQRDLETRLAAVNDAVSDGLALDFADAAGSCCHD